MTLGKCNASSASFEPFCERRQFRRNFASKGNDVGTLHISEDTIIHNGDIAASGDATPSEKENIRYPSAGFSLPLLECLTAISFIEKFLYSIAVHEGNFSLQRHQICELNESFNKHASKPLIFQDSKNFGKETFSRKV